jgi:hypothetical protein
MLLAAMLMAGLLGIASPQQAAAATPDRGEQLRFMWAMAGQESSRDYYARNTSSGAFGKYQIMPANWPVWAKQYLGDSRADQTPYNQEKVAFGKLRDLYRRLGSWRRVAYWWLTGRTERNEKRWSAYAKGYVDRIMRQRNNAPAGGYAMPARSASGATRGDWRRSGNDQGLRRSPGGPVWVDRGAVRDGQVLKVRATRTTKRGTPWARVVTADGRLGWLKLLRTVPAPRPKSPSRWSDVKDRGKPADRSFVRPRPR